MVSPCPKGWSGSIPTLVRNGPGFGCFPHGSFRWILSSGIRRRHHQHENGLQKALKDAVYRVGISKKVGCHVTHLLESGVDLRKIQQLLGHNSVETTMIYTYVEQTPMLNVKSPLDQRSALLSS